LAQAIYHDQPIDVYNDGQLVRDFTYIDDIVDGVLAVLAVLAHAPEGNPDIDRNQLTPSNSWAPYRVLNIGHAAPVIVNDMIALLEQVLGKKAIRRVCRYDTL
jgi:UDP-glucuronate 4-epimerase